jgi:shikimate kinase
MQYEEMEQEQLISTIKERLDIPVVLVGMMGSGKSHTGRELAAALGLSFQDTDMIIEKKAGAKIPEIFERDGEAKFREAEKNTILELLNGGNGVIATGGGLPMNDEAWTAMTARAVVVWLDADLEVLFKRTSRNKNRPLLQEDDPKAVLAGLLEKRKSRYGESHIRVDGSSSVGETVPEVIKALYDYLNHDNLGGL